MIRDTGIRYFKSVFFKNLFFRFLTAVLFIFLAPVLTCYSYGTETFKLPYYNLTPTHPEGDEYESSIKEQRLLKAGYFYDFCFQNISFCAEAYRVLEENHESEPYDRLQLFKYLDISLPLFSEKSGVSLNINRMTNDYIENRNNKLRKEDYLLYREIFVDLSLKLADLSTLCNMNPSCAKSLGIFKNLTEEALENIINHMKNHEGFPLGDDHLDTLLKNHPGTQLYFLLELTRIVEEQGNTIEDTIRSEGQTAEEHRNVIIDHIKSISREMSDIQYEAFKRKDPIFNDEDPEILFLKIKLKLLRTV